MKKDSAGYMVPSVMLEAMMHSGYDKKTRISAKYKRCVESAYEGGSA